MAADPTPTPASAPPTILEGHATLKAAIAQIKSAESDADVQRLAALVACAGRSAAAILMDEFRTTTSPQEALRLLEAVPRVAADELAERTLGALLRHPTPALRLRAAALVAERGYPHAGALLAAALIDEKDPIVRLSLVEISGKNRLSAAAAPLIEIAKSRAERAEVRIAACVALGRIGDASVVPALGWICYPGGIGLTRLLRGVPAAIRAAAARALGAFPNDPTARDTLRLAADDAEEAVSDAAGEVLQEPFRKRFGAAAWGMLLIYAVKEIGEESGTLGGSLSDHPIAQLCQKLGSLGKNGVLHLAFDSEIAHLWFEGNSVVAAEYAGREDAAAFTEIAHRTKGMFLFVPDVPPPRRAIRSPVAYLLKEAMRGH